MPAIHRPHSKRAEKRTPDDIPNRNRNAGIPDELAHAELGAVEHANRHEEIVRNRVLIPHGDERPDGDPDTHDLGEQVARLGREDKRNGHEPVAHDAAREVVCPVHVDAGVGLGGGVVLLCAGG